MIYFVTPESGADKIREYLDLWGAGLAGRMAIHLYEDLPAVRTTPAGTYVLSSLDGLAPAVRDLAGELRDALLQARAPVRVLNSPRETLLRYDLLAELHRLGLNRFRAVRAKDGADGLRFPVFVREENRHWASLTPLLKTPVELEAGLRSVLARGHRLRDLLVVEFCDTADREGVYRKYAAFVVGDAIIPRSLSQGTNWSLKHNRSNFSEAMVLEERAYLLENPHEQALRRICKVARVEYGRIDYALLDGGIQTWEINLNPIIGRGRRPSSGKIPDALQPLRQEGKEHFYRRFQAAFEAIDLTREAPPIPLRYRPETLRRARAALWRARVRRRWVTGEVFGPLRRLRGLLASWLTPRVLRAPRVG
ncbi:MAG TPA: hypothetical protein VGQ69_00675 [Gemmatimonadales bacterium]|jgi:hypothetical protein|nr:hypothetical protein [Gemmatimonadales bacterium]